MTIQIILKNKINNILEKRPTFLKEKYKEIVHPQVLLRIPCYDFSPVSSPTMGPHITRGTSNITTFHAMTGGEYKTQEHIHRDISDSRLLAIPTS